VVEKTKYNVEVINVRALKASLAEAGPYLYVVQIRF
jgi:hypothetical protein